MTVLTYWGIAWLVGIWLGSLLALSPPLWAGVVAATLVAAILSRSFKMRLLLSCGVALALGALRLTLAQPDFDRTSLATYNNQGRTTLVGVVADEPDVRDTYVYYKLDAQRLTRKETPGEPRAVRGAARLRGPRYPLYDYGDLLEVRGNLETPPVWKDFSYRDYLARKNIYSYIPYAQVERLETGHGSAWKRTMLRFKRRAQATISRILPEPEASLLTGILLGIESGIPEDTQEAFSATGTSHVIAISGFNIAIITALLMVTLGRILSDRRLAAAIAIIGVLAYTVLVGADAAVVRAAVMGIVTIIGMVVRRPGLALNSLAFAAITMTALNPFTLWDVGFQLSVVATLGLILYGQRFEEQARKLLARRLSAERAKQIVGWISEALLLTLAAQITTTPLILKYFGRLSLVSLLSNALILPIQPLVMFFGGTATLLGLIFEPLGRVVGWVAYLWLTWTIRVVEWTARFPHASVPLELSDLGVALVYATIGGLTAWGLLSPERRRALWQGLCQRLSLKVSLSGMALVTVVAWAAILQFPDGKLHVTFLDVGQGDAIFVETPQGVQILIDGGPEGSALLSELGRQMPFWDRTLDLVVLTHPDADHLSGLIPALERYAVRAVVVRELSEENDLVDAWGTALAAEGSTLVRGEAMTRMELSEGVRLDILHPGPDLMTETERDSNNNSVVLRLTYGKVAFLLPGDIEVPAERALLRSGAYLPSTVLKLAHHGSKTSSCQAFLDAVRPQVAVISVGQNKFGHPADEVLERLEGIPIFRTDQHGRVSITSDGRRIWIETER